MTEVFYHKRYINKYYRGKVFQIVKPYCAEVDKSCSFTTTITSPASTTTTTTTARSSFTATITSVTSTTTTARMSTDGQRRRVMRTMTRRQVLQTTGTINNPINIDDN